MFFPEDEPEIKVSSGERLVRIRLFTGLCI